MNCSPRSSSLPEIIILVPAHGHSSLVIEHHCMKDSSRRKGIAEMVAATGLMVECSFSMLNIRETPENLRSARFDHFSSYIRYTGSTYLFTPPTPSAHILAQHGKLGDACRRCIPYAFVSCSNRHTVFLVRLIHSSRYFSSYRHTSYNYTETYL